MKSFFNLGLLCCLVLVCSCNVMRKIEGLISLGVTQKKQIKFIEYICYFKQMGYAAALHTHFLLSIMIIIHRRL